MRPKNKIISTLHDSIYMTLPRSNKIIVSYHIWDSSPYMMVWHCYIFRSVLDRHGSADPVLELLGVGYRGFRPNQFSIWHPLLHMTLIWTTHFHEPNHNNFSHTPSSFVTIWASVWSTIRWSGRVQEKDPWINLWRIIYFNLLNKIVLQICTVYCNVYSSFSFGIPDSLENQLENEIKPDTSADDQHLPDIHRRSFVVCMTIGRVVVQSENLQRHNDTQDSSIRAILYTVRCTRMWWTGGSL